MLPGVDTVIQIALFSEDQSLQSALATYGVETQLADQIAPIHICPPSALRDIYASLGSNTKLGLTGRPHRPIGSLGTCKVYRAAGRTYVFTPNFMDSMEFYLTSDNEFLVSLFQGELSFIKQVCNSRLPLWATS
jgi:hypothetical protein